MSKRTDAATMTTEASKAEATKGKPEPAYRKPNQTRDGRRRQQMVADLVAKLGGADRVGLLVMEDIERVADLIMAARTARAELAAGKTSIDDVVKLENAVGRAMLRLNLPPAGAAPVGPNLQEYIASYEGDG